MWFLFQLCLRRISNYWLIHYLLVAKVDLEDAQDRMDYQLALDFLRGRDCDMIIKSLEKQSRQKSASTTTG